MAVREGCEGLVHLKLIMSGANEPGDGSLAWAGASRWGVAPPCTALVPGPPC